MDRKAKNKPCVFQSAKNFGYTHARTQVRTFKFRATRTDVVAIKSSDGGVFRGVAAMIRVN